MSKKVENAVEPKTDAPEETVTPIKYGMVVLPKQYKELNVRAKAQNDAKVLCTIKPRTKVKVEEIESAAEWFKVTLKDGVVGYCMKKFISVKQ